MGTENKIGSIRSPNITGTVYTYRYIKYRRVMVRRFRLQYGYLEEVFPVDYGKIFFLGRKFRSTDQLGTDY